jgi:serine/threonine-protein kinase RsbW
MASNGGGSPVKISLDAKADVPSLTVAGDIGHDDLPLFAEALTRAAGQAGDRIVLHLEHLTHIDSSGLRALCDLAERLNGSRVVIEIAGLSPELERVFRTSELARYEAVCMLPAADLGATSTRSPQPSHEHHALARAWARTFPSDLGELEKMRGLVEAFGRAAGLDDARVYDLKVAVSEAAANAIEHGSCDGVLGVQGKCSPERLTITVSSPGAFKPRAGGDPARSHRGMGLPLILALLDEVTITNLPDGGARVTLSMLLR